MTDTKTTVKGPIVYFLSDPGEGIPVSGELIDWRAYVLETGERADVLLVEHAGEHHLILNRAGSTIALRARDFTGAEMPDDPRVFNWWGGEVDDADGLHTMRPVE